MTYKLELCKSILEWYNFVKNSKQYNVYTSKSFLKNQFNEFDAYFLYKEGRLLIGCLLKKKYRQHNNEMYQNIYYSNYFDNLNSSKSSKLIIESTEELLKNLYKIYDNLHLSLHHSINDIRPFQWFHYYEKENKKFDLNIKYTALLDLNSYDKFEDYLNKIRPARRQDYKKSKNNSFTTFEETNSNIIVYLLEKTFERQSRGRRTYCV